MKKIITKTISTLFLFYFLTTSSFAQGIAVQGIARDVANSALKDSNLNFTFNIVKNDNTVQYSEKSTIKTDNFGVFSHIVSTGTPQSGTFNAVDFSITDLKLKVSVELNSVAVEVYNQRFQYTPYALFAQKAANGMPTGSVTAFIGTTAPAGWLICNGDVIPVNNSTQALRAILGANVPNLQGRFLKGVGQSTEANIENIALNTYATQSIKSHDHESGSLSASDNSAVAENSINKTVPIALKWANRRFADGNSNERGGISSGNNDGSFETIELIHNHSITGKVAVAGGVENRPSSYGVHYIIKL